LLAGAEWDESGAACSSFPVAHGLNRQMIIF
jgi:hypothetical protein